jgi:hypothetical protein
MRASLAAALLLGLALHSQALVLTSPASIAGTHLHSPSAFGPAPAATVQGRLVWAQPREACTPVANAAQIRGAIALARRSTPGAADRCDFAAKVRVLQAAGAALVIVVSHDGRAGVDDANELVTMTSIDAAKDVKIPSIFVTKHTGTVIDRVYANGAVFAVVNRTGESAIEDTQERKSLMQMLPGMRQVVSPFRHMAETFDGSQHAVGAQLPKHLPPRKDVLSVVLNRG